LLTLASAVGMAFLIVLISHHVQGSNARRATVIQLFVIFVGGSAHFCRSDREQAPSAAEQLTEIPAGIQAD
jgi:hypothetical protein